MLKVNVHSIVFCFAFRIFASRLVARWLQCFDWRQLLIKHMRESAHWSNIWSTSDQTSDQTYEREPLCQFNNWSVREGKVKKVKHDLTMQCFAFLSRWMVFYEQKKANMFHFVNLFLKCWTYQLECHMSDQIHWSLSGRWTPEGFSLVRSHPSSGTSLHCTSGSVRRR